MNVTWIDATPVDTITLEFNGVNYTDLSQNGNVYGMIISDLEVGTYNYVWYANDTLGNEANTGTLTYTIDKATSGVNLLLNGTDGNITVEVGDTVNESGYLYITR